MAASAVSCVERDRGAVAARAPVDRALAPMVGFGGTVVRVRSEWWQDADLYALQSGPASSGESSELQPRSLIRESIASQLPPDGRSAAAAVQGRPPDAAGIVLP